MERERHPWVDLCTFVRRGAPAGWLILGAMTGCNAVGSYVDRMAALRPDSYVVVLPQERLSLDCVGSFLEARRAEGYSVETLILRADASEEDRIRQVQEGLAALQPADGGVGYVLFLASRYELPMGPWAVEGLDKRIHSDAPLLLGRSHPPSLPLQPDDWAAPFEKGFPWIPGRIPFAEEELLAVALESGERYRGRPREADPRAQLGSERYMVWADSSFTLGGADSAFERRGWKSTLYAEDWPGDLILADPEALPGAHARLLEACGGNCAMSDPQGASASCAFPDIASAPAGTKWPYVPGPDDLLFVSHWSHLAPRVVYTCSHGTTTLTLDTATSVTINGPAGKVRYSGEQLKQRSVQEEVAKRSSVYVGDRLVSDSILESFATWAAQESVEPGPSYPAISFFSGCKTGRPNTPFQARLFREGWVCAYVSSTESVSPSPLSAGYRVQVNLGKFAGAGLPLGLALRGLQASYLDQSRHTLAYLLFPEVSHDMARNLLAFTVYGDPSLPILPPPSTPPATP
jgi:hypothetical protein